MLNLTETEKLKCIEKRIDKLAALNELFFDSLKDIEGCECADKYNFVCNNFSTYIYEVYIILGKLEYEDIDFSIDV